MYDDTQDNSNKKHKFIIIGAIAFLVLVIPVVVVSIIAINHKSSDEEVYDLKAQVYILQDSANELVDIYPSEAMQDIDEAVKEYFSPIYPSGEVLMLEKKDQLKNGDYQWYFATTNGDKHVMTVTDEGITVRIRFNDDFDKTYTNEPHPDN